MGCLGVCYEAFFPHELFLEVEGIGFTHRLAPGIGDIERLLSTYVVVVLLAYGIRS